MGRVPMETFGVGQSKSLEFVKGETRLREMACRDP